MLSVYTLEPGYALPYYQQPLQGCFFGLGDDGAPQKSAMTGLLSLAASALLIGGLLFLIRKA